MNRASFLIQELLGLAEKSAEPDVSLTPKQKADNDDHEQVGTTTSGRQRKRRRQDADSVGEEIRSYESEGIRLPAKSACVNGFTPFSFPFPLLLR